MKSTRSVQCLLPILGQRPIQLASLLLAVFLTACSSVDTKVNKGSISAHTFSFLNTGSRQVPSYAENRAQAHALVQQALINNLAAKGVRHVPAGGDVTVAYLVVVGNNAATTSLNEYFGYTDDSDAMVKKVHSEQTGGDNRNYFESGTLVIDIIDSKTSKILQRRSIQAQVLRNLTQESRTARVQSLVDQALKDVPFS